MITPLIRPILPAALISGVAGCSALKKQTNGTSTTSAQSSGGFFGSSKKVQQDLTQTQTDLGQLESQAKFAK